MKKLTVLIISLMFIMGCATMGAGPSSDVDEMKKEIAELKQEVERMRIMGAAGGAAANFYPARSQTGDAAGDADNITASDAAGNSDTLIVMTDDSEATADYDWSFSYRADNDGINCTAESVPECLDTAGGDPMYWDLLNVWGRKFKTPQSSVSNDYIELFEDSSFGGNKQTIDIDGGNDGIAADYVNTIPEATGTFLLALNGTAGDNYITQTEFIPVAWMVDDGTTGPGALTEEDNIEYKDFDSGATDEELEFMWHAPLDLTGSTLKVQVVLLFTNATTPIDTEGVSWGIAACSVTGNESHDCAVGSQIQLEDDDMNEDVDAQWDVVYLGATSAYADPSDSSAWNTLTPTGLDNGELVKFYIERSSNGDATDDFLQDVGLVGINIKYQRALDNNF